MASLLIWADFLAARFAPGFALPEQLLLTLIGSVPQFTFRPAVFLFGQRGYLLLLPVIALALWPRTRARTLQLVRGAAFLIAAWVAAMACATAYALNHTAGLVPAILAVPIAALLAAWPRWHTMSAVVLAAGFALGTAAAQAFYAFPFQDNYPELLSPLRGFLPPVIVALLGVLAITVLRRPRPVTDWRGRVVNLWGVIACVLACIVFVGTELRGVQARAADPPGSRILDDWAYDVFITGDPPQLVWTDRQHIQVLTNPYGDTHERYRLYEDGSYYVERIWASPTGGFYLQGADKLAWWAEPEGSAQLSYEPGANYRLPPELRADSSTTWTIVEDPATRRLFTVGEYFSTWAALDRDSGELLAHGKLSDAMWPFWHFTADLDARVLYATSALDDGGLYEMNLDTLAIERKARHLYLYETILDPEQHLLWGVRPLTGEVVAVDTRTWEMRHRVPVQFGLRDLQRDPRTGDLYTCSEIFGDIFRIDGRTLATERLGWCGRLCRSMYLDWRRDGLWVATRDGICRLDTSR